MSHLPIIKIAISSCPNDIFIFSGLLLNKIKTSFIDLKFSFLDIEALNQIFLEDHFDLIKISATQFQNNSNYQLLRNGGAIGYSCGPLLLSQINKKLDINSTVLLPGEQTTAHALFNFYCYHERINQNILRKKFLPFNDLYQRLKLDEKAQGVVIHESRFTYVENGLFCICDLGQYWEGITGFPIPLGVLMLKHHHESVVFERLIQESLQWAKNNFEEALNLCLQYSQEMDKEICLSHIKLYVNSFSENMGEEGRKALDFLSRSNIKRLFFLMQN